LKISTNIEFAMQCFENFEGANAPNAPALVAPAARQRSIYIEEWKNLTEVVQLSGYIYFILTVTCFRLVTRQHKLI